MNKRGGIMKKVDIIEFIIFAIALLACGIGMHMTL